MLEPTAYGKPVESHFITKYYKRLRRFGNLSEQRNFHALLSSILKERPIQQWKLHIDIEKFYNEMEDINYPDIVNKLCLLRASKRGLKAWGDKTPRYIFDLDIIDQLFPQARYIYIVRDGRDVALSLLQRPWGPNNFYCCAEYWKRCNSPNVVLDKINNQNRLYALKYEDLLHNAEQIIPMIYNFIQEPYEERKTKHLLERIQKDNCNKWKNKMSRREIRLFELVAANTLKKFGYETRHEESKVNKFISSFYHLHDSFMRAKYLLKLNFVDTIKIKLGLKQPFSE